jgi:hypothetical protein
MKTNEGNGKQLEAIEKKIKPQQFKRNPETNEVSQ